MNRFQALTWTAEYFANARIVSVKSDRYQAIGKDAKGVISVVFVYLGLEGISVISMRPASKKERKRYEEA